jgi:hypothetical protein
VAVAVRFAAWQSTVSPADGIRLDSSGNIIQGNYIGTDATGSTAQGNGQYGVFVLGTSSNLIGGTNARPEMSSRVATRPGFTS